MNGKPLIYLDNGATSLKPQAVIDREVEYLTTLGATIHRGVYEFSQRATAEYDAVREQVKAFIGARTEGEIIFTKSATEASNIIARSWGDAFLNPGDHILTTELENHANLIPWQEAAKRNGAELDFVDLGPNGEISVEEVDNALTERTRVVAVTGMSNVTGYIPQIAEIAEKVHAAGAILIVDGAQLVSHHPVDVEALDVDFLTFSAHKMCGPTGVGLLYGKKHLLDVMQPFLYGGDMIVRVKREESTYKGIPDKFEPGTPNIAGVIGLGAAIDYLNSIGMERIARHETELAGYAREQLEALEKITTYGPPGANAGGIVSFNIGDIHPHDAGSILDAEGIAVRAGFHCAQPFMRYLGIHGTVRASFYLYNTREDVDALIAGLARVEEIFG
ncbi:MAG: aminotransferase class V-fold PLP-dependent enzyme [Spirochaetota bacterium]